MLETIPRIHPIKVATTKRKHQTKTNQTKPKHQTKLATIGLKVHFHPMSETIPRIHPIKVWPTMSATALGTRHKTSTDKCISYLLYYRGDSNLLLAGSLAEFEIISLSEWLLDIRFLSDYSIIPWANTSFFWYNSISLILHWLSTYYTTRLSPRQTVSHAGPNDLRDV